VGDHTVVFAEGELCSRHSGYCTQCGAERSYTFRLPDEPRLSLERDVVFGGSEPSELLDAGEWLLVADLAASRPDGDDEDVALAAAAIDEVLKFVPPRSRRSGTGDSHLSTIRSHTTFRVWARVCNCVGEPAQVCITALLAGGAVDAFA